MNRAALAKRDARIIKLREAGKVSMTEIAARFGLSRTWATKIVRKLRPDLIGTTYGVFSPLRWPTKRVSRLKALRNAGLSYAAIGRKMGLSKSAVVGKGQRLGLDA